MRFYIRTIFIIFVCLSFFLPLLQMQYSIVPKTELQGTVGRSDYPQLTVSALRKGEYQNKFESWFNQNFGLKDIFVKTNNQLFYSFFNQTPSSSSIMVGKNNALFEGGYIEEYLNLIQPLEKRTIEEKAMDLKKVQDALQARGKSFMLLITPSKAAIYPEYIPDQLQNKQTNMVRNYDMLVPLLDKYGINYVDGHKIAMEQKKNLPYGMFPIGGIHWNNLAVYYISKAALSKMEQITGKKMIDFQLEKVEEGSPTGSDRDLADLANLWVPPVNYTSPHVTVTSKPTGAEYKPTIFMEGASFSYLFINMLQSQKVFKQMDYYYYYHMNYEFKDDAPARLVGEVTKIDWEKDIFNHDIIILEMNEQVVPRLLSGFLQDTLSTLVPIPLHFMNVSFVEKSNINGSDGYVIKKGADGKSTVYFQTENLDLTPGAEYTLSYKASGFQYLNVDLYPDGHQKFINDKITDTPTTYSYSFKLDSNIKSANIRFFIDGLNSEITKDTVVYDIKLHKNPLK